MNVNAINRTIDAIRNDKTHTFDMRSYSTCIAAFAHRSSNISDSPTDYGFGDIIDNFEIPFSESFNLAHPRFDGRLRDITREKAATVLEHFRDTGRVNWKILNKGTGLIRKWYDKVRPSVAI